MKRPAVSPFVIAILLFVAAPAWAQPKTRINWTAVTGAQSGMFMAQQEGLFKKNGLDVELIHIPSSSRGIQAILAGEIGFSFMRVSLPKPLPTLILLAFSTSFSIKASAILSKR